MIRPYVYNEIMKTMTAFATLSMVFLLSTPIMLYLFRRYRWL